MWYVRNRYFEEIHLVVQVHSSDACGYMEILSKSCY